MEEEATKLKEMQAQVEQQLNMQTGHGTIDPDPTNEVKEEIDSRSIYIGNVRLTDQGRLFHDSRRIASSFPIMRYNQQSHNHL
jgi:hypothetical protein